MKKKLYILHLEDNLNDAELIHSMLETKGVECEVTRIDTKTDFITALEQHSYDLIISDYTLPSFDGLSALKIARQKSPDIPFIFVSATIGEEAAIESLLSGATDYVLKQKISRLVPAVKRALREVEERKERKRAEEALWASEARFRGIFESAPDPIVIAATSGDIVLVNNQTEKVFGYGRDELLGKSIEILIPERFREKHKDHMKRFGLEPKSRAMGPNLDLFALRKDGSEFSVDIMLSPLRINDEVAVLAMIRDITEMKRKEEAQRLFRTLIDRSNDAIEVVDPETGRFLDINEEACLELGYSREELLSRRVSDIDPTIDQSSFPKVTEELRKIGSMIWEGYHRRKDGSTFPVEVNMKYVQLDRGYAITVVRDITERKRAERALMASEEYSRNLIDSSLDLIISVDHKRRIVEFNKAARETFGYTFDEVAGQDVSMLYADPDEGQLIHKTTIDNGRCVKEILNRRKNGEVFSTIISAAVLKDTNGQITGVMGVSREITEQKKAEEEIRMLAHSMRTISECVSVTDMKDNILFVNDAFQRTYGYEEHELLGRNVSMVRSENNLTEVVQNILPATLQGGWQGELLNCRKDGSEFPIFLSTSVVRDENGKSITIIGVATDITERKRLEEERKNLDRQLMQTQKMESIGTLAGGIAHDFNNILGIILGHLSLIQRNPNDLNALANSADTISKAVQRGANLVRQILTFARKTDVSQEPVSVNATITELSRMLQETFPKTIEIVLSLDKNIPIIPMDQTQLHQAILNLCINARDAMTDPSPTKLKHGTLTIRTELLLGGQLLVKLDSSAESQYVCVSVSDTGMGMDGAMKERIFEPFFTTKEQGKGTGLGLAVVYGVVKSYKGHIEVESEIGHGTTFRLYLPISKHVMSPVKMGKAKTVEIKGGTEQILLVDDEEGLLNMMKTILEGKGYHVITARDGIEAIQLYTEHKESIALVLSDLGLPKLDGLAVFSTIKDINPRVKVAIASGYIEPSTKSELFKIGIKDIVQKPYQPDEVLRKIRQILDLN